MYLFEEVRVNVVEQPVTPSTLQTEPAILIVFGFG